MALIGALTYVRSHLLPTSRKKVNGIRRLAGSSFCHTRAQAASSCDGGRSRHRLDLTYILVWQKTLPAGRRRSRRKAFEYSPIVGQPLTVRPSALGIDQIRILDEFSQLPN